MIIIVSRMTVASSKGALRNSSHLNCASALILVYTNLLRTSGAVAESAHMLTLVCQELIFFLLASEYHEAVEYTHLHCHLSRTEIAMQPGLRLHDKVCKDCFSSYLASRKNCIEKSDELFRVLSS